MYTNKRVQFKKYKNKQHVTTILKHMHTYVILCIVIIIPRY